MPQGFQNSDYPPDNILPLYCDAHTLPTRCRVRVANTDQRFCGILHYLEMFCSCLNKREKRLKLRAVPCQFPKKNFYRSSEVQLKLHYSSLNCCFGGLMLRNSFTSILAKRALAFKDNLFLERIILLVYRNQFQADLKKFSCRLNSLYVCKGLNERKSGI